MSLPITVTFRGLPHSDNIENYVRDRCDKLPTFFDRITACHVVVESPHKHQRSGRQYRVLISLTVPGGQVVVSHAPGDDPTNQDAYAAVDEAFDRVGRRLEDHVRRQRVEVKRHEASYQEGRVAKLWSYEGYGFLVKPEGGEVYFHRNAVLNGGWGRIKIGSSVRFIEEDGQKGPQASTVAVLG